MRRKDTDKHSLYVKMYEAAKTTNNKGSFLKEVFNGVRAIDTLPYENTYTKEQLEVGCKLSDEVTELLKQSTLKQIMNAFPIHKEYDGEKWGSKDYFSTMDYLKGMNLEKPIGDNLEEFLWHYYHWDLMQFHIIHDSYHRERGYLEEREKVEKFQQEIHDKFEEIMHIGELILQGDEFIQENTKKIEALKCDMNSKPRILAFSNKLEIKRLEKKRYEDYLLCGALLEYRKDLMVEYASIEGWDEGIEQLAQHDREEANKYIGMRNKMLNRCYQ